MCGVWACGEWLCGLWTCGVWSWNAPHSAQKLLQLQYVLHGHVGCPQPDKVSAPQSQSPEHGSLSRRCTIVTSSSLSTVVSSSVPSSNRSTFQVEHNGKVTNTANTTHVKHLAMRPTAAYSLGGPALRDKILRRRCDGTPDRCVL